MKFAPISALFWKNKAEIGVGTIFVSPSLKGRGRRQSSDGGPDVSALSAERVIQLFYLRACGLFVRGRVRVSTVSLTGLRPKRMASPAFGTQMSILCPRTEPPVSATTYSPL